MVSSEEEIQAEEMYSWAVDLFPINRSLTGQGVRDTLKYLKKLLPELSIKEVRSGVKAFDWQIPLEWNVKEAYIIDPNGRKLCDFRENNLHLVGYSLPMRKTLELEALQNHLHSLPEKPMAIPYLTSYYKKDWGFCLSDKERRKLKKGSYQVVIDSSLQKGKMNYGEIYFKGLTKKEIIFSTYICHPSMANNELSGPVVAAALARYVKDLSPILSYRFLFVPETIGSIYFISRHLQHLQENLLAGFILTCCGDEARFSYMPSRSGDTRADMIILETLKELKAPFKKYSFVQRGSDERQYCSPNVNLPVAAVMKSKYGEYKEYHTSLDNLDFISAKGLLESFILYRSIIDASELGVTLVPNYFCEPFLTKHFNYPNLSGQQIAQDWVNIKHILAFLDGKKNLREIGREIGLSSSELKPVVKKIIKTSLVSVK